MRKAGNARAFCATRWSRKAGSYSTTCNTPKSKAAIIARAHGRRVSIQRYGFYFRRCPCHYRPTGGTGGLGGNGSGGGLGGGGVGAGGAGVGLGPGLGAWILS